MGRHKYVFVTFPSKTDPARSGNGAVDGGAGSGAMSFPKEDEKRESDHDKQSNAELCNLSA